MKRLNPTTGLPFKRQDRRKDSMIFMGYSKKLKNSGFFGEIWISQETWDKEAKIQKHRSRKWKSTPRGKAHCLIRDAKDRGKVSITPEWLTKKLEAGVCELTGLPFDLSSGGKNIPKLFAPSLDKINAKNKNYSYKNTRVVLFAVNCALGSFGEKEILPILEAMVKGIKKNAKKNTATPVPTRHHREGKTDT